MLPRFPRDYISPGPGRARGQHEPAILLHRSDGAEIAPAAAGQRSNLQMRQVGGGRQGLHVQTDAKTPLPWIVLRFGPAAQPRLLGKNGYQIPKSSLRSSVAVTRCVNTTMTASTEGLIGVVERELGQQVESGDLFLFFNRRADRVKVLWFEGDGLVIWYKRLEGGTFEVPKATRAVREDGSTSPAGIEMRLSDLTLILEGIDLASVRHRPRWRRA